MNRENVLPLVGKVIRVDRGGPESSAGLLLSCGDDYVAVLVEDTVYQVKKENEVTFVSEDELGDNNNGALRFKDYSCIYYQTQHIKSISLDTRKNTHGTIETPEDMDYIEENTFKDVVDSMRYQWVKINRGGPEKIEGILLEANEDFFVVIRNEEIVRLSRFHVRSLSYSVLKVEDPVPVEGNNNGNGNSNNNESKNE